VVKSDAQARSRTYGTAPGARRRWWGNPVVEFVAVGLVALIVLIVGSGELSKRAATDEAIIDAQSTTELLAQSVVEPALPAGLVAGQAAALDKSDRLARHRLMVGDVLRLKIWTRTGKIIYSDETALIGEQFSLDEEELEILADGGTAAEVSDLSKPENRFEQEFGRLLEVYTQVYAPHGRPLLFEVYFSYEDISRRSAEVLNAFRPITVVGLLLFLIVTGSLVWVLARRLDAAAAERERLLVAAVQASDAERRRIARDLHDGVVQDLAGISFAMSATEQEVADRPAVASRLSALGGGVRHSLRMLRSLLVEIYPPNLHAAGLAAALDDLLAPVAASGVQVQLDVADTTHLPENTIALMWRVAQEAIRNATSHGSPTWIGVRVETTADAVRLEVSDNGSGFDPSRSPERGHFGLRGLRDLVTEAGGRLDVVSTPGAGTRVRMEVFRR